MAFWTKLGWLALAGALGTLARYGLSGLAQRALGAAFPWGTLIVNVVGCFLAGLLWVFAEERMRFGGEMRAIVFIGFLGAFTTFSALIFETNQLMRDAEWWQAAGNLLLQNGIGLAVFLLGSVVGRTL